MTKERIDENHPWVTEYACSVLPDTGHFELAPPPLHKKAELSFYNNYKYMINDLILVSVVFKSHQKKKYAVQISYLYRTIGQNSNGAVTTCFDDLIGQ